MLACAITTVTARPTWFRSAGAQSGSLPKPVFKRSDLVSIPTEEEVVYEMICIIVALDGIEALLSGSWTTNGTTSLLLHIEGRRSIVEKGARHECALKTLRGCNSTSRCITLYWCGEGGNVMTMRTKISGDATVISYQSPTNLEIILDGLSKGRPRAPNKATDRTARR